MFTHPPGDLRQFRFFTSQLIEAGSCKPVDIICTFGVSKSSVDRSLKKLRKEGPAAFFRERTTRRGGKVFILVFDREGYSPGFMKEMWQKHRIGCVTYKKFTGKDKDWPLETFRNTDVKMPDGELVVMRLAEQGSQIGSGGKEIWVREVRKLTDSGHQTSLISTAYDLPHDDLAARMFSRWCQENFSAI